MEGEVSSSNVTPESTSDVSESSGAQDGQQSGAQPGEGKETNQSVKEQIRELGEQDLDALVKIKVNGQEKKVKLREALKISQLEQASHAKMQEAAQLKRKAQEFAKFAKENPKEFMKYLGLDPYAFAEATLAEKLEMMQLTPEQKQMREMQQRIKQFEEQERARKEHEERQKMTAEETKAAESLDKEITEAFMESGLPKDPFYVERMAVEMIKAEKRGEQLSAKQAASIIKDRFFSTTKAHLEAMDAQAIYEMLGPSVLKKLREHDVKRVTAGAAPTSASGGNRPGNTPVTKKQGPTKPMSEKQWREWVQKHKA